MEFVVFDKASYTWLGGVINAGKAQCLSVFGKKSVHNKAEATDSHVNEAVTQTVNNYRIITNEEEMRVFVGFLCGKEGSTISKCVRKCTCVIGEHVCFVGRTWGCFSTKEDERVRRGGQVGKKFV